MLTVGLIASIVPPSFHATSRPAEISLANSAVLFIGGYCECKGDSLHLGLGGVNSRKVLLELPEGR